MHSGDLTELGGANLTDAERGALLQVMQRAKDFDEKSQRAMNSRLEGQLSKWTNALKGWQPRWLSVDQQQGVLHYYTSEDRKKAPPRGSLHLWGAVIAPSDEDSQTFTVNGANGEVYKLRAADAKERQYWVSRLRNEIERCTSAHTGHVKTQVPSTTTTPQHTVTSSTVSSSSPLSPVTTHTTPLSPSSQVNTTPTRKNSRSRGRGLAALASRASLKKRSTKHRRSSQTVEQEDELPGGEAMLELLTRLIEYQTTLTSQLESCSGMGVSPLSDNVLLLKATSEAAVHTVKDCLALIKLQRGTAATNKPSLPAAVSTSHNSEEEEVGGGGREETGDRGGEERGETEKQVLPEGQSSGGPQDQEPSKPAPSSPTWSATVTTV